MIVSSSPDAFWTAVFSKYYLSQSVLDAESSDDLLFFVRRVHDDPANRHYGSTNSINNLVRACSFYRLLLPFIFVPCFPNISAKISCSRMLFMCFEKIQGTCQASEILCTIGKRQSIWISSCNRFAIHRHWIIFSPLVHEMIYCDHVSVWIHTDLRRLFSNWGSGAPNPEKDITGLCHWSCAAIVNGPLCLTAVSLCLTAGVEGLCVSK